MAMWVLFFYSPWFDFIVCDVFRVKVKFCSNVKSWLCEFSFFILCGLISLCMMSLGLG